MGAAYSRIRTAVRAAVPTRIADMERHNAALQATCVEIQQCAEQVVKLNETMQDKLSARQELHRHIMHLAAESRSLDMQVQVNAAMSADEVGSYAAASFDIEALHDVAAAVAAKAAIAQAMSGRLNELDAQIKVLASEATRISSKLSEDGRLVVQHRDAIERAAVDVQRLATVRHR